MTTWFEILSYINMEHVNFDTYDGGTNINISRLHDLVSQIVDPCNIMMNVTDTYDIMLTNSISSVISGVDLLVDS